ncbi:MAG: DUF5688 family protein [Lachnospiraceae bacterium]|nr:DUF5688 family protein [Lachnospiraceae bacterium]
MNRDEFYTMLKEALEARLGSDIRIDRSCVIKNNGIEEEGLTIMEPGKNISPNILIDPLFRKYEQGESVISLADRVIGILRCKEVDDFDVDAFVSFEKAKKRIVFKLINLEKNEKLLREIPHIRYMDLAMVFYYLLPEKEDEGIRSILIRNSHLKIWNVDAEKIGKVAKKNTPKLLPAAIIGMGDLLRQMVKTIDIPEDIDNNPRMYVMSNAKRMNGAATIAYPDTLKNFADTCGKNFYVIPSSVHEVILIPESGNESGLNDMVSEVNRTQVDPKEVLADHVYYYNRDDHRLVGIVSEKSVYC